MNIEEDRFKLTNPFSESFNDALDRMFLLGVEFGVKWSERGQNLQYALDKARQFNKEFKEARFAKK